MIQKIQNIAIRIWKLISCSESTWDTIALEHPTPHELRRNFLFPLIAVCVVETFLCSLLYASADRLQTAFLQALYATIVLFGGYFATNGICFWALQKKYPNRFLAEDCTKVITYCFAAIVVIRMLLALMPSLFFLQILSIYVGIMMWQAARTVFGMTEDERSGVVLLFSLLIIFTPSVIGFALRLLIPHANF